MSREAVYRILIDRHHWTPAQIAAMTPAQQVMALMPDEQSDRDVLTLATQAEYARYLALRQKGLA